MGFQFVLKSVMSETVRKSAGRVPCRWTGKRESALSEFGTQPRCDLARRVSVRTQPRTCHSGDGRLHDVTQVTWTLPGSDVVHQNAQLVSYSKADW